MQKQTPSPPFFGLLGQSSHAFLPNAVLIVLEVFIFVLSQSVEVFIFILSQSFDDTFQLMEVLSLSVKLFVLPPNGTLVIFSGFPVQLHPQFQQTLRGIGGYVQITSSRKSCPHFGQVSTTIILLYRTFLQILLALPL